MSADVVKWTAAGVDGRDAADRKTHIRRAYVRTVAAKDSVTVLAVVGVPALGAAHPSLAGAKVVDRRPRSMGNGYEWEVDIEYELDLNPANPRNSTPTSWTIADPIPTNEPWEFDQDYQEIEVVPATLAEVPSPGGAIGSAKNPSINTAGEAFGDPVTEPVWCQVLRLEKNILAAGISPSTAAAYQGSTNSVQLAVAGVTIPLRCGLMRRSQVRRRYYGEGPTAYWRALFEIVVFPSAITTDIPVLQRGYNQLVAAVLTPVYAADGSPIRTPVLLDSAGAETTTPKIRYFARTNRQNWGSLNLPSTVDGLIP